MAFLRQCLNDVRRRFEERDDSCAFPRLELPLVDAQVESAFLHSRTVDLASDTGNWSNSKAAIGSTSAYRRGAGRVTAARSGG
jgi:hypothetical protein